MTTSNDVHTIARAWDLSWRLARRELKAQYRGTAFGYLWSLAHPLTLMVVYTLVFGVIVRIPPERGEPSGLHSYALWLLCALLPWTFFVRTVNSGTAALVSNPNLVTNVYLPRAGLVFGSAIASLVTWGIELVVLIVALVVIGAHLLLLLPAVVGFALLLALFGAGLALGLSVLNVRYRDTQHLVAVVLQLLFFASPILYPMSMVESFASGTGAVFGRVFVDDLYMLNPVAHFSVAFRSLLYDNAMPSATTVAACVGFALFSVSGGLWVFLRFERRLAEWM